MEVAQGSIVSHLRSFRDFCVSLRLHTDIAEQFYSLSLHAMLAGKADIMVDGKARGSAKLERQAAPPADVEL